MAWRWFCFLSLVPAISIPLFPHSVSHSSPLPVDWMISVCFSFPCSYPTGPGNLGIPMTLRSCHAACPSIPTEGLRHHARVTGVLSPFQATQASIPQFWDHFLWNVAVCHPFILSQIPRCWGIWWARCCNTRISMYMSLNWSKHCSMMNLSVVKCHLYTR